MFAAGFVAVATIAMGATKLESKYLVRLSWVATLVMALTGLGIIFEIFPDTTGVEGRVGFAAYLVWIFSISI